MIKRMATAAMAALALAGGTQAARADEVRMDEVRVTGEGQVQGRPDILRVNAAVELRRPDAAQAYDATASEAARLVKVIADSGVAERDIRTTDLSVQPEYVPDKYPLISGYRGTEGVTAVVRDLRRASATLKAIMGAGQDVRLNQVAFDKADWSAEREAAQEEAFKDAKAKAERYARFAERRLGRVLSISAESAEPVPVQPLPKMMLAAAAAEDGHLSPGERTVSATVHVVYLLA